MNTEYDFVQTINPSQLLDEISTAGIPSPAYICTNGTAVSIFYSTPLTSQQLSTLSSVVANHICNPNYVSLQIQSQISTLVGYLNNTNVSIANEARAAILANVAPNLPLATLTAINNQIAATIT